MGLSRSLSAYNAEYELFERALEEGDGYILVCRTNAEAIQQRRKLNYYRQLERNENMKIYPGEHPKHGKSEYDQFQLRIPRAGDPLDNTVIFKRCSPEDFEILPLSATKEEILQATARLRARTELGGATAKAQTSLTDRLARGILTEVDLETIDVDALAPEANPAK